MPPGRRYDGSIGPAGRRPRNPKPPKPPKGGDGCAVLVLGALLATMAGAAELIRGVIN